MKKIYNKNTQHKIIAIALIVCLVFTLSTVAAMAAANVDDRPPGPMKMPEEVQNIIPDCVAVMLQHEFDYVDAETLCSMFNGMGFDKLVDICAWVLELAGIDEYDFGYRLLRLDIPVENQNVEYALAAVERLRKLDYVLYADPNGRLYPFGLGFGAPSDIDEEAILLSSACYALNPYDGGNGSGSPLTTPAVQDFKPDCVLVVLKHEFNHVDGETLQSMFNGMGFTKLIDINSLVLELGGVAEYDFGFRFLRLELPVQDQDKGHVLAAIERLLTLDCVLSAEPNWYRHYADGGTGPIDAPDVELGFCAYYDLDPDMQIPADFNPNCVLVRLKHEFSNVDSKTLFSMFNKMWFDRMVDLTANELEVLGYHDDFIRVLRLDLPAQDQDIEHALAAIERLKKLYFVLDAEPACAADADPELCAYYNLKLDYTFGAPTAPWWKESHWSGDSLLVILKDEYKNVDAAMLPSMFGGMGFSQIVDRPGLSCFFGLRIVELFLEEPGEDNVLEAIKMLEQLEYVKAAQVVNLTSSEYPGRAVGAFLDADAVSDIERDVEYTVTLRFAKGLLTLEFEFEIDGNLLAFDRIVSLSGFEPSSGVLWENMGDGVWRGKIELVYTGNEPFGFETPPNGAAMDVLKFVFSPCGQGDATIKLTGFKSFGYDILWDWAPVYRDSWIARGEATTSVQQLTWSKYDLNKDNTTDSLDLGILLLYCGFDEDSPNWDTLMKVNDSRGNGVTASMCDVNGDGLIDMLDLIDMFIHYTK
ncbi:MAG: hypothetical protein FWG42_04400 [Clostridiales bacterium]|nr:hypothetical protein [Clostridiales bacterium]